LVSNTSQVILRPSQVGAFELDHKHVYVYVSLS
jgi:hypothetical protein